MLTWHLSEISSIFSKLLKRSSISLFSSLLLEQRHLHNQLHIIASTPLLLVWLYVFQFHPLHFFLSCLKDPFHFYCIVSYKCCQFPYIIFYNRIALLFYCLLSSIFLVCFLKYNTNIFQKQAKYIKIIKIDFIYYIINFLYALCLSCWTWRTTVS